MFCQIWINNSSWFKIIFCVYSACVLSRFVECELDFSFMKLFSASKLFSFQPVITTNNSTRTRPPDRSLSAAIPEKSHKFLIAATAFSVLIIEHSPIAVATPHTFIKGFRHVNGDSCRRRFFASIFYHALIALSMYTNQNCQTQWLSHVICGASMSRFRFAYFRHCTSVTFTWIFRPRTQFCNLNFHHDEQKQLS